MNYDRLQITAKYWDIGTNCRYLK